ncbi:ATPase family associated with various cellular activities (AAA) [Paracoccus aminovorans]|uniref:ATPase family associated with various cellular activities (AAA) n=1 Tax=Paracoccus aminovorans TaxID=34004 RepID=A0A1I3AUG3_9RHOB|nr:ATP-binding protein [Paracoccus aminovorans]CQR86503.1 AAA ATPase [Paracoccus aminovorans]SFH53653.1 ATPase family associated with various cellular activities (AAA) [Paracoccus aminovorans]
MTRREIISPAALQARALDLAGQHAMALLARGPGSDLRAALSDLAALGPVALLRIAERFGLTALELDLLCLIAAPELGPEPAAALAAHPLALQGRATPALCALVLGAEAGPALSATALLRQGALVEALPGTGLAQRLLVLPEAVASALLGAPAPDPAVLGALTPCPPAPHPQAGMLADALLAARGLDPAPILHLAASDPAEAAALVAAAGARLGLRAAALDPSALSIEPARAAQLLNRDAVLTETAFLLPASPEGCQIADRLQAPCLLWGIEPHRTQRPRASIAPVRAAPLPRSALADAEASHAVGLTADLPALIRTRAAQGLEGLAQRIEPQARWDDLVLPPAQMQQLRQLAASRRHGPLVLDGWGFRAKSARGLALTALFSGASGTGKTMAAEILARALCDDDLGSGGGALALYRVDLAALTSKYIGETQKNVGRIFDAAENAGAVLLFDEGEALFARRSPEVKDSHDRHANAETSYLLQRLESYSGIAIVTTNLRAAVDDAFLRRFRAVIDFPFPDAAQRALIWRAVLPQALPRAGIDYDALARLAVAGGFIRAIALTAAWLAAESGGPLTMAHLERAARQEYMKLGKPLSEAELRGFR